MKSYARTSFFLPHMLMSLLMVCAFFGPANLQAQRINEGTRPFEKKVSGNALTINIEGQPKNVEAVVDQEFQSFSRASVSKLGGMKLFARKKKNVGGIEIYYDVDKANREGTQSKVTLFMSTGNNNFMTSNSHPKEMKQAKEILKGLQLEVTKYEMGLAIEAQNVVISKSIKEHEKMVKDSIKLEEQLAKTLEEIENNKISRANQLVTIEEEKQRLVEMEQDLTALKDEGLDKAEAKIQDNMEKLDKAKRGDDEEGEVDKKKNEDAEEEDDGGR